MSRPEEISSNEVPGAGQAPKRTSVIAGGRRKIHTTFPDGSEMVNQLR